MLQTVINVRMLSIGKRGVKKVGRQSEVMGTNVTCNRHY